MTMPTNVNEGQVVTVARESRMAFEAVSPWRRWVAALAVSAFQAVACGDDTMVSPVDAGVDATSPADATVDATDAAVDAPVDAVEASPVDLGRDYATRRGCPFCHQDPDAGTLSGSIVAHSPSPVRAYPKNLTPDPQTGLGGWSDDQIQRAIRTAVDDEWAPLCVMPAFADMGDFEVANIIAYLRSLPPVYRVIPDSICPWDLDAGLDADEGGG